MIKENQKLTQISRVISSPGAQYQSDTIPVPISEDILQQLVDGCKWVLSPYYPLTAAPQEVASMPPTEGRGQSERHADSGRSPFNAIHYLGG